MSALLLHGVQSLPVAFFPGMDLFFLREKIVFLTKKTVPLAFQRFNIRNVFPTQPLFKLRNTAIDLTDGFILILLGFRCFLMRVSDLFLLLFPCPALCFRLGSAPEFQLAGITCQEFICG